MSGLPRFSDIWLLQGDTVAHNLLGSARFTVPEAKQIGGRTWPCSGERGMAFGGRGCVTLDLDSHVKTVYGNQQLASNGYNPKNLGRKSYHPLFCFIGETRDFLWGRFRPGNRYSGHGAASVLGGV